MSRWVKAAEAADFESLPPDQPSVAVDLEGYDLVVFRLRDGWGALDNTCSHEFWELSQGEVWNDKVYCEKHGSAFDCRTGRVHGLPATDDVPAFNVEEREGEIWVELPDYS